MKDLYLCDKPLAKTPYFLEEISKNIYSLEELCYYLLHNVILLDKSFMSMRLCTWIGEDCDYKELAEKLKKKIRNQASLAEFVNAIMTETEFCSRRDIDDVNYLLRQMEEKSDFERSKIRADKLMENRRYINSIYEYNRILKMKSAREQNSVLLGSVWHNLGCAYAKMLLFTEAQECFEKSYTLCGKKDALSNLLICCLCRGDEEAFQLLGKKYMVNALSLDNLRGEYQRAANTEQTRAFRDRLENMENQKNHNEFRRQSGELISEWKEEYRNFCRLH